MRAFIGISLPQDVRASLAQVIGDLSRGTTGVRWVAPESLHITLKFLGEISEAQREPVEGLVRQAAATQRVFTARLESIGAFPSLRSPRVIWAGVADGAASVAALAGTIEQGCRRLGFSAEERPFSAHVTLGRVASSRPDRSLIERLSSVAWEAPAPWPVTAVTVYRSHLASTGVRYETLAEAPLATGAAN